MTLPQKCPHCGGDVNADREHPGQPAVCGHCGKEFNLPRDQECRAGSSRCSTAKIVLISLAVSVGLAIAVASLQSPRRLGRSPCERNLHQLAIAMVNYEAKNGSFPPAFVADKNGKPMHSWRALLLPYLEGEPARLAAQYNFDEPWDSPNNRKVTDVALDVFRCPTQPDAGFPSASYMMVVGPHTISDGPHARSMDDIASADGTCVTIMLVEVANSDVQWAEPRDLEFNQLDFKINNRAKQSISSPHGNGANVVFCDGHGGFLPNNTPPEHLKAMLTIDGGEKIPDDF
jgi:prepilin-type processing-associated H-X9-DG protein